MVVSCDRSPEPRRHTFPHHIFNHTKCLLWVWQLNSAAQQPMRAQWSHDRWVWSRGGSRCEGCYKNMNFGKPSETRAARYAPHLSVWDTCVWETHTCPDILSLVLCVPGRFYCLQRSECHLSAQAVRKRPTPSDRAASHRTSIVRTTFTFIVILSVCTWPAGVGNLLVQALEGRTGDQMLFRW